MHISTSNIKFDHGKMKYLKDLLLIYTLWGGGIGNVDSNIVYRQTVLIID